MCSFPEFDRVMRKGYSIEYLRLEINLEMDSRLNVNSRTYKTPWMAKLGEK